MAKDNKKKVEQITDMEVDFAQWYTDVCKKAELIDYSSIKGMFIYRPYGYAIWENIQKELDRRFKETGHENVYLPMLIPESLLQKEKDHVEGFAPECAWVTYGGSDELEVQRGRRQDRLHLAHEAGDVDVQRAQDRRDADEDREDGQQDEIGEAGRRLGGPAVEVQQDGVTQEGDEEAGPDPFHISFHRTLRRRGAGPLGGHTAGPLRIVSRTSTREGGTV